MKKLLKITIPVVLFALVFTSCSNDDDNTTPPTPEDNIVELAQDTESLSSLVAALAKADEKIDIDLIGTLSGEGPFTVFAPTNQAFADLLSQIDGYDSLEDFDTDEEKDLLAEILTYHVIMGESYAADLSDGDIITTVQGENLEIMIDNSVMIDDATNTNATVTQADTMASNGVVHLINKVLVPQAVLDILENMAMEKNLVELVMENENLSILEAAVVKAGLVETLSGEGPFTVFAPTNEAFENLFEDLGEDYNSIDDFDTQAEIDLLTSILTYHAVAGSADFSDDLSNGDMLTTVNGETITVMKTTENVSITDATGGNSLIIIADLEASNGVAHVINRVLLPE